MSKAFPTHEERIADALLDSPELIDLINKWAHGQLNDPAFYESLGRLHDRIAEKVYGPSVPDDPLARLGSFGSLYSDDVDFAGVPACPYSDPKNWGIGA